jgi:hypothetical protein
VSWNAYQGYDGDTNNLHNARISGKYLSLRAAFNDYRMMTLSGFDLDVT